MQSIINLLNWLNQNWASIVTIIVLVLGLTAKVISFIKAWQAKTEEQKEEALKKAINAVILSLVSDAEVNWNEQGMGVIKRAEVIQKLYTQFPELSTIIDQDSLTAYIDEKIKEALITVREKLRQETVKELTDVKVVIEDGNSETM